MSTFHSQIRVTNNSDVELELDKDESSGIHSEWPDTLSNQPGENEYTFKQGFDAQIKFTAVYKAPNGAKERLEFYADAVQKFSQGMDSDPSNAFGGSEYGLMSNYSPYFTINGEAVAPA